ncbi:MAG: Isoquinoline 1-oxidoreductase subunit [Beijerinckiaceae bacterium]|nr:Isoquinoline 1-oxidoreductase subunit [Beijerinckiaceae bacterium]
MIRLAIICFLATAAALIGFDPLRSDRADAQPSPKSLQDSASFASIADANQRSIALFAEAGKVLQHPRCMNCHPATRRPTQAENLHPHVPPMLAGDGGTGAPGLPCSTCHRQENTATLSAGITTVPGAPHWGLAPASMGWQGRTLGQICEQIKDPGRNGGRSLAQIKSHMAEDHLVGWAWHPGDGREPAPGTQAQFGGLIDAWIATGANCPSG